MSNSGFDSYAYRIKNSPWIWLIFLVFVLLFFISVGLFIEDLTTSYRGYRDWPTAKANWWVIGLVALLPQVGQVALAYTFIDKKKFIYFMVALILFGVDMLTDVYYKSYGFQSTQLVSYSMIESFALYSLGSEVMLAFSLGMLRAIWPALISGRAKGATPAYRQDRG